MVQIANFASVFEIAFAMNALFLIYDAIPRTEDRITRLFEKYEETKREKIRITKNHEAFPIGFFVGATYPLYKTVLKTVSIPMSVISVGMLIWSAFSPEAQIASGWMVCILIALLGVVPVSSSILFGLTTSRIKSAIYILEEQITRHHEAIIQRQIAADRVTLQAGCPSVKKDGPAETTGSK